MREAIRDPGGASSSRDVDDEHVAFDNGNGLGLHDIHAFGAIFPHPARSRSTLRTPRYRDARKTWFRPVRDDLAGWDLHPRVIRQFIGALPLTVEI